MTDTERIKAELASPTGGRVYTGDPVADAAEMNRKVSVGEQHVRIPKGALKMLLAERGVLMRLLAATSEAARLAQLVLADPDWVDLNPRDATTAATMDALVSEGVMTADDRAAVVAIGTVPVLQSLPEQWELRREVTPAEIQEARA